MVTDQELRDLVAVVTRTQAELAEQQKETDRQLRETERVIRESAVETDRQLRETERVIRESAVETERVIRDNAAETDRQLRELGRQLGGLGDKFGSFTEGMALPSMTKILMQRFGMKMVSPRVRVRKDGRTIELDVLAYSNSDRNEAYIVEVKSHLRDEGLDQLRKILREFRDFFPEHAGKKVYGILAAVDIVEEVAEKALREGIYLARIHDDQFDIQVPADFQPRAF